MTDILKQNKTNTNCGSSSQLALPLVKLIKSVVRNELPPARGSLFPKFYSLDSRVTDTASGDKYDMLKLSFVQKEISSLVAANYMQKNQ